MALPPKPQRTTCAHKTTIINRRQQALLATMQPLLFSRALPALRQTASSPLCPPVPPQAPSSKSAKGWVGPLPINPPPINPLPLGSFPIHPFARSPFAFGSFLLRQPATPLLQTARPPPPTPVFNQRTATRRRTPHISSHASQVPRTKGLVWRSCPKLLCGPCPGVNVVASPSGHSF